MLIPESMVGLADLRLQASTISDLASVDVGSVRIGLLAGMS